MQTLNSVHSRGMAGGIMGISVLLIAAILLLSFTPFLSSAATTAVTVQTDKASYPGVAGTSIIVSGTVTPAPGVSGDYVTIIVSNTAGLFQTNPAAVDSSTGAYSITVTSGSASNNWVNGTYTIRAVFASSISGPTYSASTTIQYGTPTTTSTSTSNSTSSGGATTIVNETTTTIITTVQQGGTTVVTTVQQGGTTMITTVQQGGTGTNTTVEALAIVGIVIAIIAGALAAMALRKH